MSSSVGDVDGTGVSFTINGKLHQVAARDVDPNVTLNDYIRETALLKGTKLACGEGGCGACVVMVSSKNPATGLVEHGSVNSCLRPLAVMNGSAVTTTEGIGGERKSCGLHPVQKRIAELHGTQCGYCTPGFVMSIYSGLKMKSGREEGVTSKEMESFIDGNLCRYCALHPFARSHALVSL
jgi:xanthine dehydrogenase/oxidase